MNIGKRTLLFGAAALCATTAWAGTDLYFVTYNHYISKDEVEVMLMNDFTMPSKVARQDDGQHNYFPQMIEIEYGITKQWAVEGMVEAFEEPHTGRSKFTGYRLETRYRLFENDVPFNPVLYVEYEDLSLDTRYKMEVSGWVRPPYRDNGKEPDRERIMETRLVLSQDFGPWNVAANWINESDLQNDGLTAFGYAVGVRYNFNGGHYAHAMEKSTAHDPATAATEHAHHEHAEHARWYRPSVGLEFYGALGDTEAFALEPKRQQHYVQPVVMFHLNEHVMFHLGFAFGLSKASDDLLRTALAVEF